MKRALNKLLRPKAFSCRLPVFSSHLKFIRMKILLVSLSFRVSWIEVLHAGFFFLLLACLPASSWSSHRKISDKHFRCEWGNKFLYGMLGKRMSFSSKSALNAEDLFSIFGHSRTGNSQELLQRLICDHETSEL